MRNVTKWIALCNCPKTPVVTSPYPSDNHNSLVTRLNNGPCDGGTEVIADSVRTGGLEWPMNTNDRINNSEETWAFLKKFSLKDGTSVLYSQLLASSGNVSAFYSSGTIHFQGLKEHSQLQLIDTKGRLTVNAYVNQSQVVLKDRIQGMYILRIINADTQPVSTKLVVN